jgi:hypothetical protein
MWRPFSSKGALAVALLLGLTARGTTAFIAGGGTPRVRDVRRDAHKGPEVRHRRARAPIDRGVSTLEGQCDSGSVTCLSTQTILLAFSIIAGVVWCLRRCKRGATCCSVRVRSWRGSHQGPWPRLPRPRRVWGSSAGMRIGRRSSRSSSPWVSPGRLSFNRKRWRRLRTFPWGIVIAAGWYVSRRGDDSNPLLSSPMGEQPSVKVYVKPPY